MSAIESKSRDERKAEALELVRFLLNELLLVENDVIESLTGLLADAWVDIGYLEEDLKKLAELNKEAAQALNIFSFTNDSNEDLRILRSYVLSLLEENDNPAARKLNEGMKLHRSAIARHAASARAKKPGGSVEKRNKIKKIWSSGKYSSRNICAEEECAGLGISYATARRALHNTPDPKD